MCRSRNSSAQQGKVQQAGGKVPKSNRQAKQKARLAKLTRDYEVSAWDLECSAM